MDPISHASALAPSRRRAARALAAAAALLLTASLVAAGCGSKAPSKGHGRKHAQSSGPWPSAPRTIAEDAGCSFTSPRRADPVHIGENPELRLEPKGWTSNPPASGEHFGITSRWGLFDRQVQDAYSVHDLEHGGVVIWYGARPQDVHDSFAKVAKSLVKVVISPRKDLAAGQLDLVAWGIVVRCPASVTDKLGPAGTTSFLEKWGTAALDGDWAPEKGVPAVVAGTRQSTRGDGTSLLTLPTPPKPVVDTTIKQG